MADPADASAKWPDYVQTDVPRALDIGLLPAIGDKRFAKAATPARDKGKLTYDYVEGESPSEVKAAVRAADGEILQTQGKRVRAAVPGKDLVARVCCTSR
ncbi:hypothetical protein [Actinoplanes sp. NPDC051859]|uniref:hypothetical protein n=1 Tax=Actinoplanes sp. NPDC051859 TaxID=3363909 RepID=UPI003788C2DA